MFTTNFTSLRANLSCLMDKVARDHVPLFITRSSKETMVLISLSDFASMDETMYLTKSPKNRDRLAQSLENIKLKKYKHEKIDV